MAVKNGMVPHDLGRSSLDAHGLVGSQHELIESTTTDPGTGYPKTLTFNLDLMTQFPEGDIQTEAGKFLEEWSNSLGIIPTELRLVSEKPTFLTSTLRVYSYQRFIGDLELRSAIFQIVFKEVTPGEFKIAKVNNYTYGPMVVTNSDEYASPDEVIDLSGLEGFRIKNDYEVILPRATPDGRYEFVKAADYSVTDEAGTKHYIVTVSGEHHEILAAKSFIHEARLVSKAHDRSYLQPAQDFPLAHMHINGGTTDADGVIEANGAVTFPLEGTHSKVYDATGIGTEDLLLGRRAPQPVQLQANLSATGDTVVATNNLPAVNAFVAVNRIAEFTLEFLKPSESQHLSRAIDVRVNIADECNAIYYDGSSINFFQRGPQCGNTSLINDIIYHEWGHGLDDFMGTRSQVGPIVTGITDDAFGEGVGDIIAYYMTQDPKMGLGFFNNRTNQVVRNLENNTSEKDLPPQCNDNIPGCEIHTRGTIISGAFHRFTENMKKRYGPITGHRMAANAFYKHLGTTDTYARSYATIQTINGNGNPRGPDFCTIRDAFAAHGLTDEPACQDQNFIETDDTVKMAIEDLDGDTAILMGSSATADKMALCFDTKYNCLQTQTSNLELVSSHSAGSLKVFKTAQRIKLSPGLVMTLFSYEQGKLTAARGIAFSNESATPAAASTPQRSR